MRRAPRITVDLPVSLHLLNQTVKGRITDLSLTGAHITLPEKVKLHVPIINLKFPLLSTKSPDTRSVSPGSPPHHFRGWG